MANLPVRQRELPDETDSEGEGARDLAATASTESRIEAILKLIEVEELAAALDVTAATVRNWLSGHATPRRPALRSLDDLRRTVVILGEAGIVDGDCAQWLRSRQGGALENDRPLDVIAADPLRVLAAATGAVLRAQEAASGSLKVVPE